MEKEKRYNLMSYELFEDTIRISCNKSFQNHYSKYCDFIYYHSSINPELRLAMRVLKPAKPSYILVKTHGWHMSIPEFVPMDTPVENMDYLTLEVDMRGRAFSEGNQDCNGWELYDIIDAVAYAQAHYREYISDSSVIYFEGGSGGGGNAYAIIGKFPDFFAACTSLCGITDYQTWYEGDSIGEFRDEMDVWINGTPSEKPMAYKTRSGLHLLENLHTPLFVAHGETDERISVEHARNYMERAKSLGKDHLIHYLELKEVGTRAHWGNASKEQLERLQYFSEKNRQDNRKEIHLPEKGRLVVGGYLYTKRFSVVLDSIDKLAVLEYDLTKDQFQLYSEGDIEYTITKYSNR